MGKFTDFHFYWEEYGAYPGRDYPLKGVVMDDLNPGMSGRVRAPVDRGA
jgi:hypothetical protein